MNKYRAVLGDPNAMDGERVKIEFEADSDTEALDRANNKIILEMLPSHYKVIWLLRLTEVLIFSDYGSKLPDWRE